MIELSWLLSRGYAETASLKLVGDRHGLRTRQRMAVRRAACSDESLRLRCARRIPLDSLRGGTLFIDAFNLMTTLEAALGGGVVIVCRDGCLRDIQGVHGTWRRVAETAEVALGVGRLLMEAGLARWVFCLDRPVSNSGRLRKLLLDQGRQRGWPVEAVVADDVDGLLVSSGQVVASADGPVIERARAWVNLARRFVEQSERQAFLVDLEVGEDLT